MKGKKSWKEHKHHQMQAEESKMAKKRREYDSYPSAKYCEESTKDGK